MFLGYSLLFFMGITLGLMGAGGSILSIPILVYVFEIPFIHATSYVLALVGVTSLVGCIRQKKRIDFYRGILFAIPSMASVYLTRLYILPFIPQEIFGVEKNKLLIGLFVAAMYITSFLMVKSKSQDSSKEKFKPTLISVLKIALISSCLGILMGLISIGGGFLILPALTLFLNIPVKNAVATSLFIITLNALLGFAADFNNSIVIDYQYLIFFACATIIGLLTGSQITSYISSKNLKRSFSYFVMALATFIAVKEFFM